MKLKDYLTSVPEENVLRNIEIIEEYNDDAVIYLMRKLYTGMMDLIEQYETVDTDMQIDVEISGMEQDKTDVYIYFNPVADEDRVTNRTQYTGVEYPYMEVVLKQTGLFHNNIRNTILSGAIGLGSVNRF